MNMISMIVIHLRTLALPLRDLDDVLLLAVLELLRDHVHLQQSALTRTQPDVDWPVENNKPLSSAEDLIQQLQKRRQVTADETNEFTGTTSDEWK